MTLDQQWGVGELKLGSDHQCLHRQTTWPGKLCNRDKGHAGDHSRKERAGDRVIETWWPADPWTGVGAVDA